MPKPSKKDLQGLVDKLIQDTMRALCWVVSLEYRNLFMKKIEAIILEDKETTEKLCCPDAHILGVKGVKEQMAVIWSKEQDFFSSSRTKLRN